MNLDHDFFQVSKLTEDRTKKSLHQNFEIFFPEFKWCKPRSSDLRADRGQIIGGMQM